MLLCTVTFTVLLFGLSNASSKDSKDTYKVPEAEIEVIHPKGFRISIDDSPGLNLVLFYVNIERASGNGNNRNFSKYVRHKQDGKWTFVKRNARLNTGDKIVHSVFVLKDGLGFVSNNGECHVEELESPGRNNRRGRTDIKICKTCEDSPSQTESPETEDNTDNHLSTSICEQTILNTTQTLVSLQSQLMKLSKSNEQLTSAILKYPNAKKLTLSGQIPTDDNPIMTVSFILREKLNLNPGIVSAVRNSDNSITFEVDSLDEKVEILEEAKEKLKHSKIIII